MSVNRQVGEIESWDGAQASEILIPDSVSTWPDDDEVHIFGDGRIAVFPNAKIARSDDENLKLFPMGSRLVQLLAERVDEVVPYQDIRDELWGSWYKSSYQSNALNIVFSNLRAGMGPQLGDTILSMEQLKLTEGLD